MIFRPTVKNYEIYRNGFEAHFKVRDTAAFKNMRAFRSTETPNELVVINEIDDKGCSGTSAAFDDVKTGNSRQELIGMYYSYCPNQVYK
jgi:hypothetical protein